MHPERGVALIAVIFLIIFAAIAVLGIAVFVRQSLSLNVTRANMEGAIAAAQAGVYTAINDYLGIGEPATGSYWEKANDVSIGGGSGYTVGADADFLLVDADNPQVVTVSGGVSYNAVRRIPISNINADQAIAVNRMRVDFNFAGGVNRVWLTGVYRNVIPNALSGVEFNINPPVTLDPQTAYAADNNNMWRFNVSVPFNAIIVVTFFFTDGSSRAVYLMNNGRSGNNEFSITSTGECAGSRRTIEATYDVGVSRITSWQETEGHI